MSLYGDKHRIQTRERTMTNHSDLHVVIGTGPIGRAVVEELHELGRRVRAINRRGTGPVPEGVELVAGDASNPESMKHALVDAEVVYFCANPPYTKWPELFPSMQAAVIEGAASTGSKVVAMENLYMYGPTNGRALSEDLPSAATNRKGSVRAQMANDLMDAHRSGRIRATSGRASDYFGPRGMLSAMGERVFYPALAGKKVQVLGDPDQPHTYTYIPDIARGLVTLGERDEADGRAWHLPSAPAVTTRQFIEAICSAAGTVPRIQATPRWVVSGLSLVNGNLRELKEMLYEFEEPYVVDDRDFRIAFDAHETPREEAIGATVEWFRTHPKTAA